MFNLNISAQKIQKTPDSYFGQCYEFSISKPLYELTEQFPNIDSTVNRIKEIKDGVKTHATPYDNQNPNELEDRVRQLSAGSRAISAPLVNFEGQNSSDNSGSLDPTGAAGPNHYVQAINSKYRVYSKTGNPLMSSLNLKSLWSEASDDICDPIVLYDKFADRWFIQIMDGVTNKILIAVSTSPDPTGTFYKYTFIPNASDFPDYPKFSIWSDGYYMTAYFLNTNSGKYSPRVVIFDREKMLAGDSKSGMIVAPFNPSASAPISGEKLFSALTLDADGQLPPYGTPNYLIYYLDNNQQSGVTDASAMYKITTTWGSKTAEVVFDNLLPVQSFNSYFTGNASEDISQPGTTEKLQALDGFFSYRAPYRVWTGYNSFVVCNAVNTGNKVAGVRWYELRQDSMNKAWNIYQQGTYSPVDNVSRWVPSIAMDDNGSIGLAYTVSDSGNVYPGIRYTGRLANDPLGQMTFAEQTAIAGTSSLLGTNNRWGDYSHTALDPDGFTFWHTNMYSSNGAKTRIFSFKLTGTTGIMDSQDQSEFIVCQSDNLLHIKASRLISDNKMNVDLFNNNGKLITGKTVFPASNAFITSIDVSELATGMYLVRIGNGSFQRVVKVILFK